MAASADSGGNSTGSVGGDGGDTYISRRTLQMTMMVVSVALILLFFLGSIGNLLSLRILFHQRMRNQVNMMLGSLCISDTLFLFHCFFFTGINIYKKFDRVEGEGWRVLLYPYLGAYGSVVTARITSCLTTLLCVERCVAVFYPMKARIICSRRNTAGAILVITLLTMLAFIPFIYKYEAAQIVQEHNTTIYILNKTEFYMSNVRFYSVYGTVLNIVFRFAPLIIIPILNVCMIRAVHQAWRLRRDISGHHGKGMARPAGQRPLGSTREHRITIMLVIVSFMFIVCIMPGAVSSIVTHILPDYSRLGRYRNLYMFISSLTFLLETVNSSINYIIYMAMCRKFRLLYKEKYCCGHGKYYSKISVSSVKDRFKWVSSRKSTDSDPIAIDSFRNAVSDSGPNRHKPASRRAMYSPVHSDEFPVREKRKHGNQPLWILESQCCINRRTPQNSDEEKFNSTSDSFLNGVGCYGECSAGHSNGVLYNRKGQKEKTTPPRRDERDRRKFHRLLRSPLRQRDTPANPDYYKRTMNEIYNIDQELPFISDNAFVKEVHGIVRSKV